MPCQYYSAIRNDIIFIVLPPSYQGSARDAMQTKYIYFNTMIIACCYFYCIAITTLLIVLHCHYPLAVVIAIEHHIFVHRHVRAFLLMQIPLRKVIRFIQRASALKRVIMQPQPLSIPIRCHDFCPILDTIVSNTKNFSTFFVPV